MRDTIATRSRRAGKAWVWIVVSLAVLGGAGVALWFILSGKISSDFDLVPRDAQLVATIRVAEVLESEQVKKLKTTIQQYAGREFDKGMQQLSAFEDGVGMKLTDIERLTVVLMNAEKAEVWFLIHTKKDIDESRVVKLLPNAEEKSHEGKSYHWSKKGDVAVHFVNARLAVVAPETGMQRCLEVARNGPGSGPLKDALRLASKDKNHIVIGANIGKLLDMRNGRTKLEQEAKNADGPGQQLARAVLNLKTVTGTMQLDKDMDTEIIGEFETADAAKDAVEGMNAFIDDFREKMKKFGKDSPAQLAEYLAKIKPEQSGSTVTIRLESGPMVLVGLLLPAVQKVREAAARTAGQDNFHQIMNAVHNYASTNDNRLPPSAIVDKNGKPLLSWRVALLPELEQMNLYRQFKLDEPWDSPNNLQQLDRMPRVYDMPSMVAPQRGYTFVQTFIGAGTLYPRPGNSAFNIGNLPDGSAFTIFYSLGARAVPWTAPEDIVVDQGPIKPKLAFGPSGVAAAMGDGTVRTFSRSFSEQMLRWLIDPSDGNAVDLDE